jgi:ArpU family phage transcriptional regulator
MNWKNEAVNDLSTYTRRKESLVNIKQQIEAINMQLTSIRSSASDSGPVMGGVSQYEDRILDNIVKRDRLMLTYRATREIVKLIEKGIAGLDERERLLLDRFYIHRAKGNVEQLMSELDYERSRVYQIKDEALYKFTIVMYGINEY